MLFVRVLWCLWMAFMVVDIARAEPRPDFAVNGQISGSATVNTLALQGKDIFNNMTSKVLNPQGGYNRVATATTAITTIATRVSTAGQTLMQAIASLSTNNSGPIATYFDAVTNAIAALRAVITGGLTTELNTIAANLENNIPSKFTDSFNVLRASLTALASPLAALRTAVQNARNAAGNTNPIPAATIRRYVTTRVVSDFTNAVRVINSDLPVLVYIIRWTLESLQIADEYLLSITDEAKLRAQEVLDNVALFGEEMEVYVGTIKTGLEEKLTEPYEALQAEYEADLEPTLTAISGYPALFEPIFDTMMSIYSDEPELGELIDTVFTTFIEGALALVDGNLQFYGVAVCTPLQNLIQVKISDGSHSDFCYSKYLKKVMDMINFNTIDTADCYRLQSLRFAGFREGLLNIAQLIVHDIEDFIELLDTCTLFHDMSTCTSYLAGEYTTLFAYTTTKRGYLERLLRKETEAGLLRLEACISNSKHLLILDAETMDADITQCKLFGPIAR